jgi:FtsP/CotA-like multicopper oxidase with cupredoxin domain
MCVRSQVDEFQIAVAETYDVIVEPSDDRAYTLSAKASTGRAWRVRRSPRARGWQPKSRRLRKRPLATMKDMGMGGMDHGAMAGATAGATPGADDCPPEHAAMGHCTTLQAAHAGDERQVRATGGEHGPFDARFLGRARREEDADRPDDLADADGPDGRARPGAG